MHWDLTAALACRGQGGNEDTREETSGMVQEREGGS